MATPPTRTTLPGPDQDSLPGATLGAGWCLAVLHSPDRAAVARQVPLGARLGLGRVAGPEVEVAVDDPRVSRCHATVTRIGELVEIQDHGSRNGTHVNGTRVAASPLCPGDIVRIGDTLLELGAVAAPAPASAGAPQGTAPAFRAAVALAERVAPSDLPVLLLGETGTGKELLARHLHARSGRSGPLVAVNCAALAPELVEATLFGHRRGAFTGATEDAPGLFLQAQGGTLFLDEVAELTLAHQAKLLRALDSGEVLPVGGARHLRSDARVVAATNAELPARIADGRFRADLYGRLAGAVVRLPPLRARRGDILGLAERFLAGSPPGPERRLSAQAAERLLLHPWPRNVRELQAAMRSLGLRLGERLEARRADVEAVLEAPDPGPLSGPPVAGAGRAAARPSREELAARLGELRGNVSRLAAHYGKDAKQVYRWLKRYGLDPASHR